MGSSLITKYSSWPFSIRGYRTDKTLSISTGDSIFKSSTIPLIVPSETKPILSRIMKEMQDYIRSVIYERLNIDDIGSVDFTKLSNSQYIDKALKEAYSIFEDLYAED